MTYIFLNRSCMDLLKLGFWHGDACNARVQTSNDDRFDQVIVTGVDAQSSHTGSVTSHETEFTQRRVEIIAQRGDIPEGIWTDKVLESAESF